MSNGFKLDSTVPLYTAVIYMYTTLYSSDPLCLQPSLVLLSDYLLYASSTADCKILMNNCYYKSHWSVKYV